MLDDFMTRAVLAGIGVALTAAPLGCFVVWRRMAYFGDAMSHAAMLGVAAALLTEMPVTLGVLSAALLAGGVVTLMTGRDRTSDTALGVVAHSALAAGLVAVALAGQRVSLESYLFGDILAVGRADLAVIWGGGAIAAGVVIWRWPRLLTATLNGDLARASGIDPAREALWLTLALATLVALALKVVGVLLVGAMLIIPAATARRVAGSPSAMAVWAAGTGALSAVGGLWAAWVLDTPAGPSIVCAAAALFVLSAVIPSR